VHTPSSTLPREPDESFLRRFLSGEPAAARTALRWARETAYFRGFGLTREEREDAVQDALAQVWTLAARPGFETRRGLRALLRTIVAARCVDRVRRRRRLAELGESLEDPAPRPDELALAADEGARLRLALIELDEPCREIIRLRFFEEVDYATLAAREGRSESALRGRLFACLKALRRRMRSAPA
jgi:RNA polymerase sigma factor (sigma-70 family)